MMSHVPFRFLFSWLSIWIVASCFNAAFAQNKVNITTANPSEIHICAESATFEIDVRNITTGTLSGLTCEVTLPTGVEYVSGSVSGTGVSESSISNLQKPIFSLPTLALAKTSNFKIKITASCNMITFLTNGGLPQAKTTVYYSGGYTTATATPFNIVQPSVKITSVTNQFSTGSLGSVITRQITISNGGKGKVSAINFRQINEKGLKIIGVSGGSIKTSGDTIFSNLDKTHFQKVGNKDDFLSQGESIIIYDTLKVIGCSNLKSYYNLTWGCDGKSCASDNSSANVSISTISPKLIFTPKSSTTTCFGSSNKHAQELVIKNTGNDTARNIALNIFQGVNTGYYSYELSRIDETSIQYKLGTTSASTISPVSTTLNYSAGGWSCLGSTAIGAVDLLLPDLLPNETITLTWNSISCCTDACGMAFYAHRWKYSATYVNQCGNTLSAPEAFGSYGYYQGFAASAYTPSDVIDNQNIQLTFNITTASLLTPTSSARMLMTIKIPSGLSHSKAAKDFQIEDDYGNVWQPSSVYQQNDTVFALFIGAPKLTLVKSELKIKLTGDCSSNSKNGELDYGLNIWYNPNPSCNDACNYLLYCFTSKIRIHCDRSCNSGFKFTDFDARRITFGDPDNNNDGQPDASGSLDMDKVKWERVMYGDTLLTTFRGKINAVGSTTSWRYLKATSTIDQGYYMKAADVRLKIYRAGNLLYSCNGISPSYTTSGYSRTFTFDVGISALISARCPLYSGFLFNVRDSVELEVKYVYDINPGGVVKEVSLYNEMYLSTVANPTSAQRYQCDTFGGKFVMIGYYYTNYGKGIYSTNSCNDIEVNQGYYLSVGNCCSNYAGNNIFPYEYRNWSMVSKAVVVLPTGFEIKHARFYQYRTTGTGTTAWQYTDSLKPSYVSTDTVIYDVESLHTPYGGKLIPSDDGFYGFFYYKLQANCAATKGKSFVTYDFLMANQNYLGSKVEVVHSSATDDEIVYDKPDVLFEVEQNDIKAKLDTAVWNVRISNVSNVSKAEYVWLSYVKNGNTVITEVKNRTTGQIIKPTNDIFRLGDLPASNTIDLEVKAIFKRCYKDSFELLTGLNCSGYPDSLAQFPCAPLSQTISYTPINTKISAVLKDSIIEVDLCAKVPYSINLVNEGEARIYDLYLDVVVRSGMILADTAWGFEPGSNDSFAVIGFSKQGNNVYRYYISPFSKNLQANGLSGFSSGLPNEMKFKFSLTTNCNFVSSSYFLLKPGGNLKCGKAVVAYYSVGKPINIKNVKKPYFSSLKLEVSALDVCNYAGKMKIKFINLGPDTTGIKDKIQLLLPEGIYVDTTYLNSLYSGPASNPIITNNGQYKAEWSIPNHTVPGDSSYFEINTFVIPSEIACGYTQIIGQAVVKQPALCVADSTWCNIDVATSSDLILDSIQKSIYQISYSSGTSVPSGNNELASIQYKITNVGALKQNGTLLKVKYIDDVNGNDKYDLGESIIHVDSIISAIDKNQSTTLNSSFLIKPAQTCRLLLLIDSSNCVCDIAFLKVPPIRVINAGRDTISCSLVDISIGTPALTGCTYTWSPPYGVTKKDSALTYFNYANTGKYDNTYQLILTTNKGPCSTNDTAFITLYPAMQLPLADSFNLCNGDSLIIGALVQGGKGFKTYSWSPNYAISNQNSVLVWAKPSATTTYKIAVVDGGGCMITDSTKINVVARPRADFLSVDTCAKELFQFTDNTADGSIGLDSVFWDFGNLGSSNFRNTSIFIDSSQVLMVRYFVHDSVGCFHDTIKPVTVYPLPTGMFTPHDDCQGDSNNISNQSQLSSGTFTSIWNVEGQKILSKNLLHTFNNPGTFPIGLELVSDKGCKSSFTDTLTIHTKPEASIQTGDQCLSDSTSFAYSISNTKDSIIKTEWFMGDGATSTNPTLNYLFKDTGIYTATLYTESIFGCRDTSTAKQQVHPIPKANFTAFDECLGDTSMIVSSSVLSGDKVNTLKWDLGQGWQNGKDTMSKIYSNPGLYTIKHIAISDFGCSDTIQKNMFIHAREVVNFGKVGNCQESPIVFNFNPKDVDSLQSVRWIFNDQDTFWGTTISHRFSNAGIQKATITTTTKWGCPFDSTLNFVIDPKPIANFNAVLPCSDNQVNFTNTSTTGSGNITSNLWDLDDGTMVNSVDVNHVYQQLGTFNVQLIVENSFGCIDTSFNPTKIEYIVVPDFIFDPACVFDSVSFEDKTTGLPPIATNTKFNLGDGTDVLNQTKFKHAYQLDKLYTVTLTVSTSPACTYDTTKSVLVYPLPIVGFDLDPPFADILNSDVTIIDKSSGASTYRYFLSDGSYYSTPGFTHFFQDSGSYEIRQTLTTNYGCMDSTSKFVSIGYLINILIPNAFSPNNDGLNEVFQPGGLGIVNYDLTIYNRWGEKIYFTDKGQPWTGEDAIPGSYMYALKMTDYKGKYHYAYGRIQLVK